MLLSEGCNFLNRQEIVVILQEQFFRCAAVSVNGLHEFGITAVHPYPVFRSSDQPLEGLVCLSS